MGWQKWRVSERAGGRGGEGFSIVQIRVLHWQTFEWCHKTALHYKAVCVCMHVHVSSHQSAHRLSYHCVSSMGAKCVFDRECIYTGCVRSKDIEDSLQMREYERCPQLQVKMCAREKVKMKNCGDEHSWHSCPHTLYIRLVVCGAGFHSSGLVQWLQTKENLLSINDTLDNGMFPTAVWIFLFVCFSMRETHCTNPGPWINGFQSLVWQTVQT